jgi:chromosome segregation ATPase
MAPSLNLQREPFFQFGSGIQALESRIKILENDVKERELQNAKLQEDLGEKDELISQLREQIEDNKGAFDLQDLAVTQLQGQVEDREEELEKQ